MSTINNWKIKDIESLIDNKIQESAHLEYKRSNSLENTDKNKNEISRDISAFANSDGGIIIYGVEEKNHLPTSIDQGIASEGKTNGSHSSNGVSKIMKTRSLVIKKR